MEDTETPAKKVAKPKGISHKKNDVEQYEIDPTKILKYARGDKVRTKKVLDRKLKRNLKEREKKFDKAVKQAARAETLLTEEAGYLETEGLERTHKFKQKDISKAVDITSAKKYFDLDLEQFGPYKTRYTRTGKFLLMGGEKGHLAAFNWQTKKLAFEVHTQETIRDVTWLHQETMLAAAQKKNVYIYDNTGTELHCLKQHRDVNRMQYLPYHFLLATVGNCGFLKYQDTSTGQLVSEIRTKLGRCDCMSQNSFNAVINLGHANGTVTMWSPTVRNPLVKMLCHRGPVLSTAVDQKGLYIASSGLDGMLKVWDVRTFKPVYTYRMEGRPAQCLAISQRGMLAAGFGPRVYVFRDGLAEKQSMPYMQHMLKSAEVGSLEFCPFEDVLGVGHSRGFTSLLVPGSGEPNFDALEVNPFETKRQRQEHEVKMLLEKVQPEMIALDPTKILRVDSATSAVKKAEKEEGVVAEVFEPKYKKKGKSSTANVVKRKQGVGQVSKREALKAANLQRKRQEREEAANQNGGLVDSGSALDRFTKGAKT